MHSCPPSFPAISQQGERVHRPSFGCCDEHKPNVAKAELLLMCWSRTPRPLVDQTSPPKTFICNLKILRFLTNSQTASDIKLDDRCLFLNDQSVSGRNGKSAGIKKKDELKNVCCSVYWRNSHIYIITCKKEKKKGKKKEFFQFQFQFVLSLSFPCSFQRKKIHFKFVLNKIAWKKNIVFRRKKQFKFI